MTDARLPARWLFAPWLDNLSDRLWRIHTSALMWSAERGTDGLIPPRTLRLLHPDGATADDAGELVAAGLWLSEGDAYRVAKWEETQALAADVEWQMERNRRKNRALRERERDRRTLPEDTVTGHVTEYVTVLGGGEERRGEERTTSTPFAENDDFSETEFGGMPPEGGMLAESGIRLPGHDGLWESVGGGEFHNLYTGEVVTA